MTEIPPKPYNYQKYLRNLKKITKNTPETYKMTKIPLKPKNYKNTL